MVGRVDDAVLLRFMFARVLANGGDEIGEYPLSFSEQFEQLNDDIALLRDYLGDAVSWVDGRIQRIDSFRYKGKRPADYVGDEDAAQRLYDDALGFTTDYDIDDDAVSKLKGGQQVIEAFKSLRR